MPIDNILRIRNAVVLSKIETIAGVDAAPSASTDAIATAGPVKISFNPNIKETDETNGSMDASAPVVAGMPCELSMDVYLKGSGVAGTAPEWGKLMRASGYSETLLGTAVPASAEACAAGGSTSTAVLGTSAAATAQQYRGMPISLTGVVAADSFIADYTAGKVATLTDLLAGSPGASSSYQILRNVLYGPASNNIPSLTHYVYSDGILYKFFGARGNAQFTLETNGLGKATFRMPCIFGGKSDAAVPSSPVYDATRPPPFQNGKALLNRVAAAISQLSVDSGVVLTMPEDPNQLEGFLPVIPTDRKITGSINPLETLVATRDVLTDLRAGTTRILHARYGQVVGNRIAFTMPAAQALNQTPGDRNKLSQIEVPFQATGRDSGLFVCVY